MFNVIGFSRSRGKRVASAVRARLPVAGLPPSLEELRRRLVTRSQDADEVIERRIANAKGEIEHCGDFDYVFVNDDFDRSYAELAHIYHAERSCRFRNIWVDAYKDALLNEAV